MIPKSKHVRTRVHTLQEGWDLCVAILAIIDSFKVKEVDLEKHLKEDIED